MATLLLTKSWDWIKNQSSRNNLDINLETETELNFEWSSKQIWMQDKKAKKNRITP